MNMKEYFINRVTGLLSRVALFCLGKELNIVISYDKKYLINDRNDYLTNIEPRVYLKITCTTACRKTGEAELQHGRKWYLSEHMPDDEIIKTAFAAYERFILHEAKEGFLVDGLPIFNPHTNFEELLKICNKEIKRK